MKQSDFENIVHQATLEIVNQSYQFVNEPTPYSVELGKLPVPGVLCLIRFQLIFPPDIHKFQVILIRRRLEDFPIKEVSFKPLYLDLRNLMFGLYNINIFPPKQYDWEFRDKESLLKQVAHAQPLIIEYGIKWLEDPLSNVEWVKQHRI